MKKKAQSLGMTKIAVLILVALVLAMVIFFMMKFGLVEKIKNMFPNLGTIKP